jgi:membrane-associated phospholipid phosphatase
MPSSSAGSEAGPFIELGTPPAAGALPAAPVSDAVRVDARPAVRGLDSTLVVAGLAYALALGGSAVAHVRAGVLDGVPVCLAGAVFIRCYSRFVPLRAVRVVRGAECGFLIVVLGLSLACLSYLGAMANLPLRDHEMIWVDRQLGFDWLHIVARLDRCPALLKLLDGAYATFTSQLIGAVLVLVVANRTRDLDRFFITFVCATFIAEIASVLVPTLGPIWALAGNVKFTNLPTIGRATGETILALRHGTLKFIDMESINGIISFPSLHAAVAVLVPFGLRWNKPLFWPIAVLDGIMLVSTVPSGNHYVADVLGGVGVAALAILCGGRAQQSIERLVRVAASNLQATLGSRFGAWNSNRL